MPGKSERASPPSSSSSSSSSSDSPSSSSSGSPTSTSSSGSSSSSSSSSDSTSSGSSTNFSSPEHPISHSTDSHVPQQAVKKVVVIAKGEWTRLPVVPRTRNRGQNPRQTSRRNTLYHLLGGSCRRLSDSSPSPPQEKPRNPAPVLPRKLSSEFLKTLPNELALSSDSDSGKATENNGTESKSKESVVTESSVGPKNKRKAESENVATQNSDSSPDEPNPHVTKRRNF